MLLRVSLPLREKYVATDPTRAKTMSSTMMPKIRRPQRRGRRVENCGPPGDQTGERAGGWSGHAPGLPARWPGEALTVLPKSSGPCPAGPWPPRNQPSGHSLIACPPIAASYPHCLYPPDLLGAKSVGDPSPPDRDHLMARRTQVNRVLG